MANKDNVKEKDSKTHKSKHLKRSNPQMTSHNAPSYMTSKDAPPRMIPSNRTLHDRPPTCSAPSSKTSSAAPLFRSPNVRTAHAASARTSNGPPAHVESTVTTSNVPDPHDVSHVAFSAGTSNVSPPSSIRGAASPSNSQPYDYDGAETLISSENVNPSETQSSGGKQTLTLELQGFLPSYAAASEIGDILRSNYDKPWNSWKKIPPKTRRFWFREFKKKFNFCPPDDKLARKNFERRGAAIMKNNLNKVRLAKKRPNWIDSKVWNTLCEHWRTSEFKKKSIQAKTNRASDCGGFSKPLHTCGSITTSQHRANLTELNGTPPDPSDLFVHTHQHRKNKAWVDQRSEHVYETYKRRLEEITQQASLQGTQPPKGIDVWTEVAGIRKGHIYGLGSESSIYAGRRNYRGSGSASTEWVQRHEFEELKIEREEMRREREDMRRERDELRDMVKQLMESLNFRPKPYTRAEVHEDDVGANNDDVADDNDDDMADDNDDMSDDNDDVFDDGEELDQEQE